MDIDKHQASVVFDAAAAMSAASSDPKWEGLIEQLSEECKRAPKTHLAFIGTALLAKAVDLHVDARLIKARIGGDRAYSARSLAKEVLVPRAMAAGVDLGVTGREPLNNQPYFRLDVVDDAAPVHGNAKEAFRLVLEMLREMERFSLKEDAMRALAAFIKVRRRFVPVYPELPAESMTIKPEALLQVVVTFVDEDSEGGRRAQAVVAGLLDVVFGPARVLSGRINDPSRKFPGDVIVRSVSGKTIEKSIEVRDKPVTSADIANFVRRVAEKGVVDAAVVAVATRQRSVDLTSLGFTDGSLFGAHVFWSWASLLTQVLFWAPATQLAATTQAAAYVVARLQEIEARVDSVQRWIDLVDEKTR
ncbi:MULTISPECIES: restriction endonuclease, SacI family [unclassified Luteibacter]|uniref:restriction endonuclease, SacI family n=1 Tax=Luteibacter sp. PvP019 TaxID=3156436 RepID=UPI0033968E03